MRCDRAQVGVQTQLASQAQETLLGTLLCFGVRPLRTADGAEENGIRATTQFKCRCRQWVTIRIEGCTAHSRFLQLELVIEPSRHRLQAAYAFGNHFRSDAVPRQDGDQALHARLRS